MVTAQPCRTDRQDIRGVLLCGQFAESCFLLCRPCSNYYALSASQLDPDGYKFHVTSTARKALVGPGGTGEGRVKPQGTGRGIGQGFTEMRGDGSIKQKWTGKIKSKKGHTKYKPKCFIRFRPIMWLYFKNRINKKEKNYIKLHNFHWKYAYR